MVNVLCILMLVEPIFVNVGFRVEVQVLVVDSLDQLIEGLVVIFLVFVIFQQRDVDVRIRRINLFDFVIQLNGLFLLFVLHIDLGEHAVITGVFGIFGNQFFQFGNHFLGVALALVDLYLLLAHQCADTGLLLENIEFFDGFIVVFRNQISLNQVRQHVDVAWVFGGESFKDFNIVVKLLQGTVKHG